MADAHGTNADFAILPDGSILVNQTQDLAANDTVELFWEFAAAVTDKSASVTESMTIAESISVSPLAVDQSTSVTDSVTVAESIEATLDSVIPSVSDSVVATESISANMPLVQSVQESVTIGESISVSFDAHPASIEESIVVNDQMWVSLSGLGEGRKRGLLLGVYP